MRSNVLLTNDIHWGKWNVRTTKCTMFWFCWIIHEMELPKVIFS
jgi:hypothetical protein